MTTTIIIRMNEDDARILKASKEDHNIKTGSKLFLMLLKKDWEKSAKDKEQEEEKSRLAIDKILNF